MDNFFKRQCVCVFIIIWLTSSQVFPNTCEPKQNKTCNLDKETVQEGGSLSVPLSNLGNLRDVCFRNSSTSKWDSTCQFVEEICKPLILNFSMHISVENKTLVMSNMTIENSGYYRILDVDGNCLGRNVFVLDSGLTNSGSSNFSFSFFDALLFVGFVVLCRVFF